MSSRFIRFAIGAILAAGLAVGSSYLGARAGMHYKMNRLLYELPQGESVRAAVREALGIQKSYSAGEQDLWIVLSVAPGKRDGYYVDIGSADGVVHSNSYILDQLGWKGICVDPFPSNMARRTCQMVKQPVFSESGRTVSFRQAGENGGITTTLDRSKEIAASAALVEFVTTTIDEILEKSKAPRHIDYMSIDVEGAEFEALKGLSFDKHEVDAITIEHNDEKEKRESIRQLLESKGYVRVRSWLTDDWYLRRELAKNYEFRLDWGFRNF